MALERTGLQLILQGHHAFVSGVKSAQQASDRLYTSFQKLSSKSSTAGLKGLKIGDVVPQGALDRLKQFTSQLDQFGMAIGRISPQIGGAMNLVAGLTGELGRMGAAMSLTTLGAVALGAALLGLGLRGAAMPGVVQAFSAVSRSAGTTANVLLSDLRKAALGTVADMELMRQANVALAGAGPQVAKALGEGGLAGLLEIARVQARATGESVDFYFQSLVSGVKRSQPQLIDNTGLVLKVGEATEKYAKSVGKSVEALTAEERQIAILNATLEAGAVGLEQYGQGALQASEYIARMRATITNTLDRLALSVQPIFTLLTNIADTILTAIVWPLQNIVIPIFYELANTIFGPISTAFNLFKSAVGTTLAPALELIHRWVVVVVGTLRALGQAFQWLVRQAARLFAPIKDIVIKYIVEPFTKLLDPVRFAEAAGRTFGAYAEGILWAANNLIFPAVLYIAELIRDLLMGFSPPKKGPLSTIDQGAANVMRAWLEGFTGVSLAPVSDMMGRVNTLLGDIALMTRDQVTALLERLDAELQPFIDNLEIAKALAQSVLDPLQRAEDAMRKRLDAAVQQFTKGGLNAEAVRVLDRQNEALEKQKSLWEGVTAEAEYQLGLKQSEQAVLRAMLAIQQARLGPEGALANNAEKVAKAAAEAAGKTGGGAAPEPSAAAAGALGGFADLESAVGEFLGVTDEEIDALFGDMGAAFQRGFMTPGMNKQMDMLKKNRKAFSDVMGEIGETPAFQKLETAFHETFGEEGSLIKDVVNFKSATELAWDGLFGNEGYMNRRWQSFKGVFSPDWNNLFAAEGGKSLSGAFASWTATIALKANELLGEGDGSLKGKFETFKTDVGDVWDGLFGSEGTLISIDLSGLRAKFDEAFVLGGGLRAPISFFRTWLNLVFGENSTLSLTKAFDNFTTQRLLDKFRNAFELAGMPESLRTPIDFFRTWLDMVFAGTGAFSLEAIWSRVSTQTIAMKFAEFGDGGTIQGYFDQFMDAAKKLFGTDGELSKIWKEAASDVDKLFSLPFVTTMNVLITAFVGALNMIALSWNTFIDSILLGQGMADLLIPDAVLEGLKMKELNYSDYAIKVPTSTPLAVPTPTPGGAAGGLFGRGLLKVHGGEVLMQQGADRMAVFPKKWVNAMDRLATAMVPYRANAAPAPIVNVQGGGGGVTNHNTFNVQSQQSMRLALARARAFGA